MKIQIKNVQIIDEAENCTYSIFACTHEDYKILFPKLNQDIQFDSDLPNDKVTTETLQRLWGCPVIKSEVAGIHGTIFFNQDSKKKYFPKSRIFAEIDRRFVNSSEREILDEFLNNLNDNSD